MADKTLEYIVRIADCKSILRAAESLNITASALSKSVQRVETQLGVRLFQRIGKTFQLTYAGSRFVDWAQQILDIEDDLGREMNRITKHEQSRINIGVTESHDELIIHSVLPVFRARYPDMEIRIQKRTLPSLLQDLHAGKVDLVISLFDRLPPGVCVHSICEDELCIIVAPGHPLAEQAIPKEGFRYPWVDFSKAMDEDFIVLPEGRGLRTSIEALWRKTDKLPHISIEVSNLVDMMRLVSLDLGISVNYPVSWKLLDIHTIPLSFGEAPVCGTHSIIWLPATELGEALQHFIDLCSACIKAASSQT